MVRKVQNQENRSDELCAIGQELWDAIFSIDCGSKIAYDEYIEHIRKCEECKKGLGIDEWIDIKDLEPLIERSKKSKKPT